MLGSVTWLEVSSPQMMSQDLQKLTGMSHSHICVRHYCKSSVLLLILWAANLTVGNTSPSGLINALVAAAETHHCQHAGMADIAWWCRGVQGWQRP